MRRLLAYVWMSMALALVYPSVSFAYSQSFTPTADAYVSAGAPASNYGSATRLYVSGTPTMRSYLRFDVQLPGGAKITGATLALYTGSGSTVVGYQAYAVSDTSWDEAAITYANAPPLGAQLGTSGGWSTAGYKAVSLPGGYIHPGLNSIGVATTALTSKSFYSREAGVDAPQLTVSYTIEGSRTFTASADSYVSALAPTTNYGSSTRLWAQGGGLMTSYLTFDVQLPAGATVTGATLQLYAGSGSTLVGYQAYAVSDTSWGEAAITYQNAPPLGAQLGTSGGWSTAGYKAVSVPASYLHSGANSIGVATTAASGRSFWSREAGANPPQLVVTYTATGSLHYAVGTSDDPSLAYALGYNVMDVAGTATPSYAKAAVDALPPGVQALVSVTNLDNTNCTTPAFSLATFEGLVDAMANDPHVYGYYISDEPHPLTCPNAAADIRARADYLHSRSPSQKAFIVVEDGSGVCGANLGCEYNALQPANTHVDLIGLDPYPCHYDSLGTAVPCDFGVIGQRVASAVANGIPLSMVVPVYQAFGQEGTTVGTPYYRTPTPSELSTIISTWNAVVPDPALDATYTLTPQCDSTCPAPQALENHPELQPVIEAHNL